MHLCQHVKGYGDCDKSQRFVLTTLDFQQSIDPVFKGQLQGQLNIKLLVASIHNLRVLLIFFDFILFVFLILAIFWLWDPL